MSHEFWDHDRTTPERWEVEHARTLGDRIGCAAQRSGCAAQRGVGCGCIGAPDCVHNDKIERATEAIFWSDFWDKNARGAREDARRLAWTVVLAVEASDG